MIQRDNQPWSAAETASIDWQDDGAPLSSFGSSVAAGGGYAVVGADRTDNAGKPTGALPGSLIRGPQAAPTA